MLPIEPTFARRALNRVTFGARDTDVAYVDTVGWPAWVAEQVAAAPGDDPILAAQRLRIRYEAPASDSRGTWKATDEERPLNYLNATSEPLWNLARDVGQSVSPVEAARPFQELMAASYIRNTHSRYQLREFMVDFWHNHFNIGKAQQRFATAELVPYDRGAIRPHALGNFRQMLEANAKSASMLIYLDNWLSRADLPNENYAREILELHTLGQSAYLGLESTTQTVVVGADSVLVGFNDQDIIQASRALSGWTVSRGPLSESRDNVGRTSSQGPAGTFVYSPSLHNTQAGSFMGVDLSKITGDMAQGLKVIDIAANHPATAAFVVGKLARRMFGDSPPATVTARGIAAWIAHQTAPNQIAEVLEAMLIDGPEVGTVAPVKVRRPYEHLIAMFRTTDMTVNASARAADALDAVRDGLFSWTGPNGRPDVNDYWLGSGSTLLTWNTSIQIPLVDSGVVSTLAAQTPLSAQASATALVEYWVGRMIGYQVSAAAMTALIDDQLGSLGVLAAAKGANATAIEAAYRRLVGLISITAEFVYR